MSKAQMTDIIILALISGVVAILTSFMGISGTIIGAVVTSFIGELLKKYLKDPIITDMENNSTNTKRKRRSPIQNKYERVDYYPRKKVQTNNDKSMITTKVLFLFPLVVILLIELIHYLGAIGIIPYDIFFSLESITNWTLFRTIGFALIIMGFYPLFSNKIASKHGIILIVVGIIELITGFADVNTHASLLYSLFSSIKEYINIAIILAILYTILTVPGDLESEKNSHRRNLNNTHNYRNYDDTRNYQNYDNAHNYQDNRSYYQEGGNHYPDNNYYEDDDEYYYYE